MCCSALLLNFPPGKTRGQSPILSSSQISHLRVMRNKQDNSHGAHSPMLTAQEMPTHCSRCTGHFSQLHINSVTLFAQSAWKEHYLLCDFSPYYPPVAELLHISCFSEFRFFAFMLPLLQRAQNLCRWKPVQPCKYTCSYWLFKYLFLIISRKEKTLWRIGELGVKNNEK